MMTVAFDQFKRESLRKLQMEEDKSPKGSIDLPIVELIRMINAHPNYVCIIVTRVVYEVTDEMETCRLPVALALEELQSFAVHRHQAMDITRQIQQNRIRQAII